MSGQIQTVFYDLEVRPKTETADAALDKIGGKLHALGNEANIPPIKVPPIEVPPLKIPPIPAPVIPPIKGGFVEGLEKDLRTLEEQKKKAFTVSEAAAFEAEIRKIKGEMDHFNHSVEEAATKGQSTFSKLKESIHGGGGGEGGGGGIAGSLLGGAVGGGVATVAIEGFKFLSEKAKEAHAATEQVTVAIAKAGLTGEAASEEIHRIGESAAKIGDDFALPANEVKQLQGTIVGFSGLTGKALDHLTEISIGASKALGLSAEGVARLVAKSSDPESEATLKRIGIQFDKNATAAEKMAIIEKKLGPSIQAAKDANNDAAGSFEKVKNDLTETAVDLGSKLFEAIGPAIKGLKDLFDGIKPVLDPLIDAISFLVKIGIEVSLFPLNAAKAFIHWAGSLGFVKDAIKGVSAAVDGTIKFIKDLIQTVENAGSWLLSLIGIDTKEDEATRKTSEALKLKADAEKEAADAANQHAAAIEAGIAWMEQEQKNLNDNIATNRRNYLANKKILADPNATPEDKAKAQEYLEDIKRVKTMVQAKVDAYAKDGEEYDNLGKKKAAKDTNLLDLAKKRSEDAAKELEINTKLARFAAGRAFSEKDQLAVDEKRLAVFNEQVENFKLLENKKYKVNADLQIKEDTLKVLDDKLKLKPKVDESALQGFFDSLAARGRSEIALGVRPKEDNLSIVDDEIDHIHQSITLANAKLVLLLSASADPSEIAKAQQAINALETSLNNKTKESSDYRKSLDYELRDAQIASMDDGKDKEFASLNEKNAKELEQFNVARALTQREFDLKFAIETRQQKELLALKKKYATEASQFEKDLVASAQKGITDIIQAAFTKREHLSKLDIADKELGFQKSEQALRKSLNSGQISQQEFSIESQKLAKQTADFRAQQENSVVAAVEVAAKKAISATLEVVNAKIAQAAVAAFVGSVETNPLGPIVGAIEGAAVSALVIASLKGIESSLGFATGGLAFTGERGVEVIGPAKDFSQFATQLVLTTGKQVAQALGNQQAANGGRQAGRQGFDFRFQPVGIPGRSINYAIKQENLLKQTERFGSLATA